MQKIAFLFTTLLCTLSLLAQDEIRFQAFGHSPQFVSDSLYSALHSTNNLDDKNRLVFAIAQAHLTYGNADSVIHYAHLLKNIGAKKDSVLTNTIRHKRLLGQGKLLNGLYDDALKVFIEGLELGINAEKRETDWLKLGLSQVYIAKNELSKAKEIVSQLAKSKDNIINAKAFFLLADIALAEGDFNSTFQYLQSSSELIATKTLPKFKLQIQLKLARLAYNKEEYKKALEIYEYVLKNALPNGYFDLYTDAVLGYGEISRLLEQYQVAEMSLSMAYANAMQWNRLELQKKIINSLRLTYQQKGDFENAYNLMTQYVAVSNEIIRKQNSEAIQELEIKYQTLQKENQIFQLKEERLEKQNEIERQKTIKKAVLYGFLALLIPTIALLYVYYQKLQAQSQLNQQQEELNSQKIATLLSSQELEIARTSLDAQQEERHRIAKQLHDSIGGNLAGIKLQLANLKNNATFQKELMSKVNDTYELVRDISHDLVPKKFNKNAFTFLVENYIEQLKNNSEIEITFSAHPKTEINSLSEKLKVELYLTIQELFTNTLKHANANNVEVHLNIHEDMLQLIFEDDGDGFDVQNLTKGIGLKNIKNRLQQLDAALLLDSTPKRGTVVTIEIPLKDINSEKV